ncbi:MAG: AAA family ATPase [Thermodesulfovibrionia bacterium]|nr:AAA family ATPase [Thermodesulfovibrionia bacterium]
MPVFIERIEIVNFKSCRDASFPLARFTSLIGYNNSGKSNIISAVQWLLRRSVLDESAFGHLRKLTNSCKLSQNLYTRE